MKYKTLEEALKALNKSFYYDSKEGAWELKNQDGTRYLHGYDSANLIPRRNAERAALKILNDYQELLDHPLTEEQKTRMEIAVRHLSSDDLEEYEEYVMGDGAKQMVETWKRADQYQRRQMQKYFHFHVGLELFETLLGLG